MHGQLDVKNRSIEIKNLLKFRRSAVYEPEFSEPEVD